VPLRRSGARSRSGGRDESGCTRNHHSSRTDVRIPPESRARLGVNFRPVSKEGPGSCRNVGGTPRTKADLAREIDKNPAAIRRLLTAPVNPELRTVVAMADALDADVRIVPRKKVRSNSKGQIPQAA
jgi:hypothetical protein